MIRLSLCVWADSLSNLRLQAEYHIDFRGGDLHESHVVHTIYPQRDEDVREQAISHCSWLVSQSSSGMHLRIGIWAYF